MARTRGVVASAIGDMTGSTTAWDMGWIPGGCAGRREREDGNFDLDGEVNGGWEVDEGEPVPRPASRSSPNESDREEDDSTMSETVGRTTGRGTGGFVTEMAGIVCEARFWFIPGAAGGDMGWSTSARTGIGISAPDPWLTSITPRPSLCVPCCGRGLMREKATLE